MQMKSHLVKMQNKAIIIIIIIIILLYIDIYIYYYYYYTIIRLEVVCIIFRL